MAPAQREDQNTAPPPVASGLPWKPLVWFGGLLVLGYAPILYRLFRQWMDDPDMGHGFFVPLVVGYIVWQQRRELISAPAAGNWLGLLVVLWGVLQLAVATLGVELFLARTAFVISLVGVILTVAGAQVTRKLAFPLLLLLFMVPIPAVIFSQITFPLQMLASRLAELVLNFVGVPAFREGNILELPNQRLSVVEACSGIRSLLSLSFLSLVYAYFFDRDAWMRWVLLVAAVPIAIIANATRVTLTGLIGEYNKEWAEGVFHAAEGWVIFMLALVMLVLTHQFLRRAIAAAQAAPEESS
jgi:exosortase